MAESFDLIVAPNSDNTGINLQLIRTGGDFVACRSVDFSPLPLSKKQALFDLRSFLRLYVEKGHEEESVARTGVFLAEDILGREIFLKLWEPQSQRSLRVLLPRAKEEGNPLGAALTRIPWEIARPSPNHETLGERNLLVRVVHDMEEPATKPMDLGKDGSLRVLFVFAEARRSRPLSARRERREIERLFDSEIFSERKIVVDFLTHGVTRERLREQIKNRSGYHVVHWSGHGHQNLLELSGVRGTADRLSGEELVSLFAEAGGFLPQLVFLSACQSGDVQQVKNWQSFLSAVRGEETGTRGVALWDDHPGRDIDIEVRPGYTGVAHALLQGGVPSVIAMRYAVGDEYARNLAIELYRALFAHTDPKSVPAALSLARKELLQRQRPDAARFDAADHATPVLYGAEDPGLAWVNERSPSLDIRDPRLHRIAELTITEHPNFVGRGWELAELGSRFIGAARSYEARPLALVTGLGGMGKTALAAEALELWEQRFEWVLLYQAKPNALGFEATLRDIHLKLSSELGRYHEKVKQRPADAIYREADAQFCGAERIDRLLRNLVQALREESILLVLDNFESNLKPPVETDSQQKEPLRTCQDPDWDSCLARLANELVGSPSRILVTCRHQLAALAGDTAAYCLRVRLGPLSAGEAALFLREHTGLSRMLFGRNETEKILAERLLQASRFHPLLMDRLARLATGGPELRAQLMAALAAIETTHDSTHLPELFATERGDPTELAYLEDALGTSIDELIRAASPEARRLLWMIAVANEPLAGGLLWSVWRGEDFEQEQLRQLKHLIETTSSLPTKFQAYLQAMPPEVREKVDALQPAEERPDPVPLLAHLLAVGLVGEEHATPGAEQSEFTCHEVVRERIRAWMTNASQDRAGLTENAIRLAYSERLEAVFYRLVHEDMTTALEAGRRALVYCVQAEQWDRLTSFANGVVTSAQNPVLIQNLISHFQAAAEVAPEGRPRWTCLANLADALRLAGHPDNSLPFYEQASEQARTASKSGDPDARVDREAFASITSNWAVALAMSGNLAASQQRQMESAKAFQLAGKPAIHTIARELEELRIKILQGQVDEVLPQVDYRLAQVESWWKLHRAGRTVPEAPDKELLARILIATLDVARQAHFAQNNPEAALQRIDSILEVKQSLGRSQEDIANDQMNRANMLVSLGRFTEAKAEMEQCLETFQGDTTRKAATISSLANVFAMQGDSMQAISLHRRALAVREQLPDPRSRANSHGNLASCLAQSNKQNLRTEAGSHWLATLVYQLVTNLRQDLQTTQRNFSTIYRRADGTGPIVPRLSELLADPLFQPLEEWLLERRTDLEEVQARADQFLESARAESLKNS